MAEEVLRGGPENHGDSGGTAGGFEGMETLAQAIELGKKITSCRM